MKTNLLLITFLLTTVCFARAEDVSDSIRLAYGSRPSTGGTGSASQANMAAAIQFPADKIGQYAHNKISKIKLHLTLGIVDELKVFITHQLAGPYTYEQTVSTPKIGWNEVTLDTPYEIGEEEIFIGYEVNGTGTLLMGTFGSSSNVLGDWYRTDESGWKHLSDDNWKKVMAIEAIVRGDHLPQTDAGLQNVILTRYPKLNQETILSGTVINKAAETIESLEFSYEINGKTQKKTISGLSILYGETGDFTDPAFRVTEEGDWDVKITITEVNGKDDINPEDNTRYKQVLCKETFDSRNVLVEIFSTEKCPNCPEGVNRIEDVLKDYDRIIKVEHHSAYGTDDFTLPASQEYEVFFGHGKGAGTYAPAIMADRCNMADFGALDRDKNPSPVPVLSTSSDLKRIIVESLAAPAYASLDLKVDTTELPKLKITVSGKSLLPITGDSSRVNIYITEDDIFSTTQAGSYGEWVHQHVLRENLTNFRGDPVDLVQGFEKEYTTEIAETWNKNRLNVVAFVANYDSDDLNNCIVYNSAEFSLYDRSAVGGIEDVSVFPNIYVSGDKLCLDGAYLQADLYNCKGEKVTTTVDRNEVDLSHLDKGIYIVRVMTKEGVKSFKINI